MFVYIWEDVLSSWLLRFLNPVWKGNHVEITHMLFFLGAPSRRKRTTLHREDDPEAPSLASSHVNFPGSTGWGLKLWSICSFKNDHFSNVRPGTFYISPENCQNESEKNHNILYWQTLLVHGGWKELLSNCHPQCVFFEKKQTLDIQTPPEKVFEPQKHT